MTLRALRSAAAVFTLSAAVVFLTSDVVGAKHKATIWAPTLHGLQKQVLLKGDVLDPQEETIEDPSDCFVFQSGARVKFTFSFTPRKHEPGAKIRLVTVNSKPSRSHWTRNLKKGKKIKLSWTQPLGRHGSVKDAVKVSIYNSRGIHVTSVAPARWYLFKAGTVNARNCIDRHAAP